MGLWFWPVDPNQRELLVDMTAEKTYLTKEEDGEYISGALLEGRYLYYAIKFESAYRTYYLDSDNDLHGDPNVSERFIEQLEGYEGYVTVSDADDCDDFDADRYPGATEICDGKDNDCVDGIPSNEITDEDSDGAVACADCDDDDPNSYPGAPEICDGKDNDCDGDFDEGLPLNAYYVDSDNDGYGDPDPGNIIYDCKEPEGEINYVLKGNDCDDNNQSANPGNLGIKDMDGSDKSDFKLGRNHVTMNPSCPQYGRISSRSSLSSSSLRTNSLFPL